MSKWNSSDWDNLRSGIGCPICLSGQPNGVAHDLGATYLTSQADAAMRGYCCVVMKRHAVELDELSEAEAAALMSDVRRVAGVLREITNCVKLNYEIHGNTIPHLHVHLYPRYRGDPFEGGPIDIRLVKASPYKGTEHSDFCQRLRTRLVTA
jgi:diadenosine tetraphosphate (Ap4A) HIT family hydrolase